MAEALAAGAHPEALRFDFRMEAEVRGERGEAAYATNAEPAFRIDENAGAKARRRLESTFAALSASADAPQLGYADLPAAMAGGIIPGSEPNAFRFTPQRVASADAEAAPLAYLVAEIDIDPAGPFIREYRIVSQAPFQAGAVRIDSFRQVFRYAYVPELCVAVVTESMTEVVGAAFLQKFQDRDILRFSDVRQASGEGRCPLGEAKTAP